LPPRSKVGLVSFARLVDQWSAKLMFYCAAKLQRRRDNAKYSLVVCANTPPEIVKRNLASCRVFARRDKVVKCALNGNLLLLCGYQVVKSSHVI
jgi:hypothetical protein